MQNNYRTLKLPKCSLQYICILQKTMDRKVREFKCSISSSNLFSKIKKKKKEEDEEEKKKKKTETELKSMSGQARCGGQTVS